MKTPVSDILGQKERVIHRTSPDATLREAVNLMNEQHIGSLLVMRGGKLAGIITERDVLVRVVAAGRNPDTTRVEEVMTPRVVVIKPTTTVQDAMKLVTEHRCRHLPVVDADGSVFGMVSIGDLTRWTVRENESYIENLSHYIWGDYSA